MSELITASSLGLTTNEEAWGDVVKNQAFLPALQVFGSQSKAVQRGKIPVGSTGVRKSEDDIINLGPSVDIALLACRFKAIQYGNDDEPALTFYQPSSPGFQKIKEAADAKAVGGGLSGYQYGPEFLVYIPSEDMFAAVFLASKSAKRSANDFRVLLGKWATFKAELIETTKYTWHAPKCVPLVNHSYTPPPEDVAGLEIKKFMTAQDSSIEKTEPSTGDSRD